MKLSRAKIFWGISISKKSSQRGEKTKDYVKIWIDPLQTLLCLSQKVIIIFNKIKKYFSVAKATLETVLFVHSFIH